MDAIDCLEFAARLRAQANEKTISRRQFCSELDWLAKEIGLFAPGDWRLRQSIAIAQSLVLLGEPFDALSRVEVALKQVATDGAIKKGTD
jgi:hypothetical protein